MNTAAHLVKVQQFEGPLDLLLQLIEQQELKVTDIALAQVTEQFLGYVRQLESVDPTAVADYLAVAARLLVLKSKAILPTLEVDSDQEESAESLAEQLVLYRQFKEVAKAVRAAEARQQQGFARQLTFEERVHFFPDPAVTPALLHRSVLKVLEDLRELDNLPKARVREAISIQQKIEHLRSTITRQVETRLSDLLGSAKSKGEAIVTFLALLELIKQRVLSASQETLFTEVVIRNVELSQPAAN